MAGIAPGLTATAGLTVEEKHTAQALGSGTVAVFATPELARLLEEAAVTALASHLEPGQTSVGIWLDLRHLAPTPVGMSVTVRATLAEVDGRRLLFELEAHDEVEKIGSGTHRRVLVDQHRFEAKASDKRR
ncbi:MAG: thioesterase family protein [Anaerolineae bacterium]